jgi:hypothetical protein
MNVQQDDLKDLIYNKVDELSVCVAPHIVRHTEYIPTLVKSGYDLNKSNIINTIVVSHISKWDEHTIPRYMNNPGFFMNVLSRYGYNLDGINQYTLIGTTELNTPHLLPILFTYVYQWAYVCNDDWFSMWSCDFNVYFKGFKYLYSMYDNPTPAIKQVSDYLILVVKNNNWWWGCVTSDPIPCLHKLHVLKVIRYITDYKP